MQKIFRSLVLALALATSTTTDAAPATLSTGAKRLVIIGSIAAVGTLGASAAIVWHNIQSKNHNGNGLDGQTDADTTAPQKGEENEKDRKDGEENNSVDDTQKPEVVESSTGNVEQSENHTTPQDQHKPTHNTSGTGKVGDKTPDNANEVANPNPDKTSAPQKETEQEAESRIIKEETQKLRTACNQAPEDSPLKKLKEEDITELARLRGELQARLRDGTTSGDKKKKVYEKQLEALNLLEKNPQGAANEIAPLKALVRNGKVFKNGDALGWGSTNHRIQGTIQLIQKIAQACAQST